MADGTQNRHMSFSDMSIRDRFNLWKARDNTTSSKKTALSSDTGGHVNENGQTNMKLLNLEMCLKNLKEELFLLGKDPPAESSGKQAFLMNMVSDFCKAIRQSCRGNYLDGVLARKSNTRIFLHFQESFSKFHANISSLRPDVESFDELDIKDGVEDLTVKGLRSRELYGFVNSQLLVSILVALVENWRPFVAHCRERIVDSVRQVCGALVGSLFGNYPELCADLAARIYKIIDRKNEILESKLESLLASEQDPFTTQDIFLEKINSARMESFVQAASDVFQNADIDALDGNVDNLKDYIKKRVGVWYMQTHGGDSKNNFEELLVLVQAYWDVASRRFVDNVCMCIESELSSELVREVEGELLLFGVTVDNETIDRYLSCPADLTDRRQSIDKEILRIETEISNLQRNDVESNERFRKYMSESWSQNGSFFSKEIQENGGLKKYMSEIDLLLRGSMITQDSQSITQYEF